mmetsp:Transcript_29089/g.49609  ORF Transcript_29089/g.49609 Transcript_29089/m.49609 type:complete len:969 (+) Transcript_29089:313-3219(+)
MKQPNLHKSIKALLLLLLLPNITNSQQFLQPPKQQSYPPYSYDEVIQFKRMIQSLPRTFDPTNPTDTCYTPLNNSDTNNDGVVSIDEYPLFIREMSNGVIDVSSFSNLPFVLQVNFVYLNCLCAFDLGADECCASVNSGGISTAGTGPGETPTEMEAEYLTVVCSDTQASVDFAIEEGVPTRSPSTVAPVTGSPTDLPTGKPTVSPSKQPTVRPSASPVVFPTTAAPVSSAPVTSAPVISPTSSPVIIPATKAPSITTQSPTTKLPTETRQPTLAPSRFVDVPTTLKPTSVEVPTTIKPTVPPTPETPSPTFEYQPSMRPSSAGPPNNPGKKPDNGDTTFEPIAPGAVAGIVLACVGVALVGVLVTSRKRKRDSEEDPSLGDLSDSKDRDLEAGEGKGSDDSPIGSDGSHMSSLSPPEDGGDMELANIKYVPETGNYVPQTIEPSPPQDPTLIPMVAGIPSPRSSRRHMDSNDDSSSAGASGWSSSAGMSSLNTESLQDAPSFDTSIDDGFSTGSPTKALATIAAASAVVETTRVTQDDSEPVFIPLDGSQSTEDDVASPPISPVGIHSTPQGEVSRADLDMAIEAGDWAAVGATAALLAGTSKSEMDSQQGSGSKLSSSISQDDSSSIDASNSREELDELMAAGNWEGVVLAASNIDEGRSKGSGSLEEDTITSGYTGGSKGERDISEIRSEVELLVRRVVPDELDNVDEMMLQFKGREEELVETLRTMQERTVAQRARQAVRKSAKMEAKARAMENREEQRKRTHSLSSEDPSFYDDSEDDSSVSDLDSQGMSTSEDQPSSKETNITSLERAVQQGDWLAVGEAAAMMGGVGIAPAAGGDSETSSYIETDSMHDSSLATSTASSDLNRETRITHLDDLITKGDWPGIIAAAGKYQAIDEQFGQATSEEELEALAEANMWKTIATHSKESVAGTDDSAAAATDWAISRSLEQIENTTGATTGDDQSV